MAEARGLPFGRPPTQLPKNQFVDERRRSLVPEIFGWVSTAPIYAFDQTITPSNGTLHLNPIGPLVTNVIVDRCRINVTTLAATTVAYTAVYLRDKDRKTLTLVPGTSAGHDATGTGVKTGNLNAPVKLLAGTDYWLAYVAVGGAPVIVGSGGTNCIMDRHAISGSFTSLPTTVLYENLARSQGVIPGVVYYHSNSI